MTDVKKLVNFAGQRAGKMGGGLTESRGDLYHLGAEVVRAHPGRPGKLSGGAGVRCGVLEQSQGLVWVRSEPETLLSCLLLKPRTNCNLRNFKSVSELE
jgi:hypothetical protein